MAASATSSTGVARVLLWGCAWLYWFNMTCVDGSGKSTLIGHLRRFLNNQGSSWAYERTFRDRSRRFLEQIALDMGYRRADEIFNTDLLAFSLAIGLVEDVLRTSITAGRVGQHK